MGQFDARSLIHPLQRKNIIGKVDFFNRAEHCIETTLKSILRYRIVNAQQNIHSVVSSNILLMHELVFYDYFDSRQVFVVQTKIDQIKFLRISGQSTYSPVQVDFFKLTHSPSAKVNSSSTIIDQTENYPIGFIKLHSPLKVVVPAEDQDHALYKKFVLE